MTKKKNTGKTITSTGLDECRKLLKNIQRKPEAAAFLQPVDWKGLNIPEYPMIIKEPMDLHTIEMKLHRKIYSDASDFAVDMNLVWNNAKRYNRPGSGVYMVAEKLGRQ